MKTKMIMAGVVGAMMSASAVADDVRTAIPNTVQQVEVQRVNEQAQAAWTIQDYVDAQREVTAPVKYMAVQRSIEDIIGHPAKL